MHFPLTQKTLLTEAERNRQSGFAMRVLLLLRWLHMRSYGTTQT